MLSVILSSLGLFKFAEKKATRNRLAEIENELAELSEKTSNQKAELQQELLKLKDTLESRKEQLSGEIEKKCPLAGRPMQKKARLENIQNWFTTIKTATYNIEHLLGEVTTYAILAVMQDLSDGKAIFVSHGEETDFESGQFNANDADPIFKKMLLFLISRKLPSLSPGISRCTFTMRWLGIDITIPLFLN